MKKILFLLAFVLSSSTLSAQQKQEIKMNFTGTVFFATDFKAGYLSMGGPGISLKKKDWTIAVNMIPSLRMINEAPKPFITPILGAGLMTTYKHLVMGLTFYYISSGYSWKIAPGIGYKF